MKKERNRTALIVSVALHSTLLLLALLPLISMIGIQDLEESRYVSIIEIAFENGDMSPASASTKPGEKQVKTVKEIQEVVVEENRQPVEEDVTVLKNEEISKVEEASVIMEEGTQEDLPVAEVEREATEETENIKDEHGGDELADKGEGEIGESITGEALANMEFEGDGVFGRQIVYHANISRLAEREGRVVVNLCINRAGDVTHVAFNREASTLTESGYVREVMKVASRYRFEADYTAPRTQCGKLTFIFEFK
jgi:hypothetical protein